MVSPTRRNSHRIRTLALPIPLRQKHHHHHRLRLRPRLHHHHQAHSGLSQMVPRDSLRVLLRHRRLHHLRRLLAPTAARWLRPLPRHRHHHHRGDRLLDGNRQLAFPLRDLH